MSKSKSKSMNRLRPAYFNGRGAGVRGEVVRLTCLRQKVMRPALGTRRRSGGQSTPLRRGQGRPVERLGVCGGNGVGKSERRAGRLIGGDWGPGNEIWRHLNDRFYRRQRSYYFALKPRFRAQPW